LVDFVVVYQALNKRAIIGRRRERILSCQLVPENEMCERKRRQFPERAASQAMMIAEVAL
jgi:hypothetical protein